MLGALLRSDQGLRTDCPAGCWTKDKPCVQPCEGHTVRHAIARISLQQPVKRNPHLAGQPVPPGHGTARGLLLSYSHARTPTLGTTPSSPPWHKNGKGAEIQSVKNTAFPHWAPKERLHTVCILLPPFPEQQHQVPSPAADPREQGLRLAASSDRAPDVK